MEILIKSILFLFYFIQFIIALKYPPIPGVLYEDNPIISTAKSRGITINEIPYLFEHVYARFIHPELDNIFDMKRTLSCLQNKRILVLGDSVLEEFIIDLGTLLSGIGNNQQELDNFIHVAGTKSPKNPVYNLPNQVVVYYHANRRNMTMISDISDTYIRHRFMGHYDIKGNYYGVRSFTEARSSYNV